MYEVVQNLTVKVNGTIKTFHIGSIVNLSEKAAQMFIRQGKLRPVAEEPQITGYELAERMCIMGENCEPEQTEPYVTDFGVLVIPWNSNKRYHYWNGGQSLCTTLKELSRCDLIPKYRSFYSEN